MLQEKVEDIFEIPKDIVFPDELNRYLRDRITVAKSLEECQQTCSQLQSDFRMLTEEAEKPILPAFAASAENINTKIVELSKNYREKCAELEKYKTKCSKLMYHLDELKKNQVEAVAPKRALSPIETEVEEFSKEKLYLQEKLVSVTNKMLEFKNLNLQLRNELRQANKMLQQETGSDLNKLQVNGSWKGRAQIICDLQEKNRNLKTKIRNIMEQRPSEGCLVNAERISTKVTMLEKENVELKAQNEASKNKIESLKSRCVMLEAEQQALKARIQDVKERSSSDLQLISSMSKQLSEAEQVKKAALKEKDCEILRLKGELKNLGSQIENYKRLLEELKTSYDALKRRKVDGQQINEEQRDCERTWTQKLQAMEEEKAKLLALIGTYKKKLDEERQQNEKCQQMYLIEKQKTVKLEGAVAKSELESLSTSRSRYSNVAQPSKTLETLKNQLELAEETNKSLRMRLQLEQAERKRDLEEFAQILTVTKQIKDT